MFGVYHIQLNICNDVPLASYRHAAVTKYFIKSFVQNKEGEGTFSLTSEVHNYINEVV